MKLALSLRRAYRIFISAGAVFTVVGVYSHIIKANDTTVALTLLMAVLGVATAWGLIEALFTSLLSFFAFNYFFIPPIGTLAIADPQQWVSLGAFLVTAVIASQLSVQAKRRAAEAEERRLDTERLYKLGQSMLLSSEMDSMARETINKVSQIFEVPEVALYLKTENVFFHSGPGPSRLNDQELRAMSEKNNSAIDTENNLSMVPVKLGGVAFGSLGIAGQKLSNAALNGVAYLVAVGIERARIFEEAGRVEALRQSEKLKTALLDALAHDFKTPLTTIKGAVSHLLGKEHDPEETELLTLANEETDRLNMLVVEVIEMARIEAGKLHPDRCPLSIAEIVAAALQELEFQLREREISLQIPDDLPLAKADFEFILQVIKQLLDNVSKYTAAGSPIHISAEAAGSKVVLHIRDEGAGIEEREQSAIFEKFYRGRGADYSARGTGLGLSIAKSIVEAHGGRIWVESQPGAGSEFSFSLPAIPEEERP